jgi:S-adenosyl-L-methionine hydrolase (adenosine-forming)
MKCPASRASRDTQPSPSVRSSEVNVSGPVITLLTDYGLEDDFVGICHGVIARICPDARVIDISHGVERHDIRGGALMLRGALRYMPVGVHVAVVDPDVGAERRAVALRLADGRLLVGPDNGVLLPSAEACGGIADAVDIARSRFRLEPVSATFHGRDVFAPIAAHLASGVAIDQVGDPLDPAELVALELPAPRLEHDVIVTHAVHIDRFGNVQLDVGHDDLIRFGLKMGHAVELALDAGAVHCARYVRTFADVTPSELLVYEDAYRVLAVAVNHGNAADRIGLAVDDELRIRPA